MCKAGVITLYEYVGYAIRMCFTIGYAIGKVVPGLDNTKIIDNGVEQEAGTRTANCDAQEMDQKPMQRFLPMPPRWMKILFVIVLVAGVATGPGRMGSSGLR